MPLPLELALQPQAVPEQSGTGGKGHASDADWAEASAQFAGLFNQALNQQAPPPAPEAQSAPPYSPLETLAAPDTESTELPAEPSLPSPAPTTGKSWKTISANLISSFQALLTQQPARQTIPNPAVTPPEAEHTDPLPEAVSLPGPETPAPTLDSAVSPDLDTPPAQTMPQPTEDPFLSAHTQIVVLPNTLQNTAELPHEPATPSDGNAKSRTATNGTEPSLDASPNTLLSHAAIFDLSGIIPLAANLNVPPQTSPASFTPDTPAVGTQQAASEQAAPPLNAPSGNASLALPGTPDLLPHFELPPAEGAHTSAFTSTAATEIEATVQPQPELASSSGTTTPTEQHADFAQAIATMPIPTKETPVPMERLQAMQEQLAPMQGDIEEAPKQPSAKPPEASPIFNQPSTPPHMPAQSQAAASPGGNKPLEAENDHPTTIESQAFSPASSPLTEPTAPVLMSGQPTSQAPDTQAVPTFMSKAQQPMEQVLEGTAYSVKNGHKELVIRLNPEHLGEVRINLISHGNQELSARLIASTPESHALLQNQVHTLKSSLESQGIQIERLSVILAGSPENTQSFGQNSNSASNQAFQQDANQNPSTRQDSSQRNPQQDAQSFASQLGQQGAFQHKQGFAHQPAASLYGGPTSGISDHSENSTETSRTQQQTGAHDNGRISLLA